MQNDGNRLLSRRVVASFDVAFIFQPNYGAIASIKWLHEAQEC